MKDIKERAQILGDKKISAKKAIEIKDYMESRLAMWEPDLSK